MSSRINFADAEAGDSCAQEGLGILRKRPSDLPDVLAPIAKAKPKKSAWRFRLPSLPTVLIALALVYISATVVILAFNLTHRVPT